MFSIGDKIMYGSEGAFTVAEYTSSPIDKNDPRQFYVLRPVHGPAGNVIITPVDNERIKMRPVMSRNEALALIDKIPSIPLLTVENEKKRRDTYRQALSGATCEDLVSIIKTVKARKEELIKNKKRISESDNDYETKARFCFYGELSISLDLPLDSIEAFIKERLSA